ncbi:unnamed protein product [Mesocestoides corti]|uniref:Uncharacterized protein n=1 Tax=Mesocestoides corti TaxID=53468 RepID=A0A0R3UAA0_MESCO|nr:unnamed protein product [Mesocestoides corti]
MISDQTKHRDPPPPCNLVRLKTPVVFRNYHHSAATSTASSDPPVPATSSPPPPTHLGVMSSTFKLHAFPPNPDQPLVHMSQISPRQTPPPRPVDHAAFVFFFGGGRFACTTERGMKRVKSLGIAAELVSAVSRGRFEVEGDCGSGSDGIDRNIMACWTAIGILKRKLENEAIVGGQHQHHQIGEQRLLKAGDSRPKQSFARVEAVLVIGHDFLPTKWPHAAEVTRFALLHPPPSDPGLPEGRARCSTSGKSIWNDTDGGSLVCAQHDGAVDVWNLLIASDVEGALDIKAPASTPSQTPLGVCLPKTPLSMATRNAAIAWHTSDRSTRSGREGDLITGLPGPLRRDDTGRHTDHRQVWRWCGPPLPLTPVPLRTPLVNNPRLSCLSWVDCRPRDLERQDRPDKKNRFDLMVQSEAQARLLTAPIKRGIGGSDWVED